MERVLNLITSLDRGGAETMIMNYYRNLDRDDIQFDFLVNREVRGAYEDEIESLGGRIYRMGPMYPLQFGKYKQDFRTFLREHPEYRIIHSHLEERSYFPLRIAKEENIPVRISHAHNEYRGFNAKMIFREYFRHQLPPYPTHKFACSAEAGRWLYGETAMNDGSVSIIHNAIDGAAYAPDATMRITMRNQMGIDANAFVLGNIGRMVAQKNQKFLLEIFAALHGMTENTKLIVMGEGELHPELMKHANDLGIDKDVIFTGSVPNVPDYLQAIDVFVLPSLFEGLPLSLIEAQAAGIPSLASDTISRSADLSGHVQYLPLETGAEQWAKNALSMKGQCRFNGMPYLRSHGYDITSEAAKLQEFYLHAAREK